MKMQTTISFFLCLCLLNIVRASTMYSSYVMNNSHEEIFCESSMENDKSCLPGPGNTTTNCHIPNIFKELFVERNQMDFDRTDSISTDGDCCCPTKVGRKRLDQKMTNVKNEMKKLAFVGCDDMELFIEVGTCSKTSGPCGVCRVVNQERALLIEENGDYKFDKFELPSHCACVG